MAAASVRNLVAGSGTATYTAFSGNRPGKLTFSASQADKLIVGSTVRIASASAVWFTIAAAYSGTIYRIAQTYASSLGATSFRITDPSTSRARGSVTAGYADLVANARYYQYAAFLDEANVADWYCYIDTVPPQNGVHPFTRDQHTGKSWMTSPQQAPTQTGVLVPNLGERISDLDGEPAVIY